eukprot:1161064-Pelagomonas_calceolata.AAC.2
MGVACGGKLLPFSCCPSPEIWSQEPRDAALLNKLKFSPSRMPYPFFCGTHVGREKNKQCMHADCCCVMLSGQEGSKATPRSTPAKPELTREVSRESDGLFQPKLCIMAGLMTMHTVLHDDVPTAPHWHWNHRFRLYGADAGPKLTDLHHSGCAELYQDFLLAVLTNLNVRCFWRWLVAGPPACLDGCFGQNVAGGRPAACHGGCVAADARQGGAAWGFTAAGSARHIICALAATLHFYCAVAVCARCGESSLCLRGPYFFSSYACGGRAACWLWVLGRARALI